MIAIYEDTGGDLNPDEFAPTALYDDGEWLAGGEEWEPYYPAGTSEEEIAAQLDGPDPVAVEVTEGSDELLSQIEKTRVQNDPADAEFDVITEIDNDDQDGDPPWASTRDERHEREKNSQSIGPTQSTLLGVGDEVHVVSEDDDNPDRDDNFSEREKDGRVVVDSVQDVPDDEVACVDVDEEGDPEEVYYEP